MEGHLEAAELNVIASEVINFLAILQIFMKLHSFGILCKRKCSATHIKICHQSCSYPCGIEGDNELSGFEGGHHPEHELHVALGGDVGLEAHVAELLLRGDVDGGVVPQPARSASLALTVEM